MEKNKKFDFRISQNGDNWKAEITRRASAKKTVISKAQDGFTSEADAQAWAEEELKAFLEKLSQRNKRHAEQRK